MNAERLTRVVTLAANIAVLVGVGLIVFELRQTREMMRAQTRNDMAVQLIDLLRDVSLNPDLAHVMGLGNAEAEMTADQTRQFNNRANAMFRYYENVHYQYRHGLYDESEFATQQEAWRNFMTNPGYARVWCGVRQSFSPDFMRSNDQLLLQPCNQAGGS
jgi:hypothetical protein